MLFFNEDKVSLNKEKLANDQAKRVEFHPKQPYAISPEEFATVWNNGLPKEERAEKDMVNHPNHYNPNGGRETLDYMEYLAGTRAMVIHCTLNAVKYRERAYKKNDKPEEDFQKAEFYMNRAQDLKDKINQGNGVEGILDFS